MLGAWFTVRVNDWVASGETPLLAVMVIGNDPPVVAVPARVAVPSPLSVNVTPLGSDPVLVIVVAAGTPGTVVTVNESATPVVKVAWSALVICGGWLTVSVKSCVPFGVMPS